MPFPLLIPALAQAGLGIYQSIKGASQAKKNDKLLQQQLAASPQYQESQYAKNMLADTQGRLGAVSPAVMMAYRNANQQAANVAGNAQRNATSGAEAISAAAGAQGAVNNVLPNLAGAQQDFEAQNRGQYYGALDNMTNERDKVFNDQVRRNMDMRNYFLGRTGAANRNLQSGINAIGTAAASIPGALSDGINTPTQTGTSSYNPYNMSAFSPAMWRRF